MGELIVGAVQIAPTTVEDVLEKIDVLLRQSERSSSIDILCFPEAWFHRNPYTLTRINLDYTYSAIIRKLCKIAEEYNMWILGGGLYNIFNDERPTIVCPVIDRQGEIKGFQQKVHLYRVEKELFKSGEKFNLFEIEGHKIGILVCHDVVYPEAARTLVLKGAEILFNPSRIVSTGVKAWHLYLMTRSLENRVPIVGANVFLKPEYGGGSIVIGLRQKANHIAYPKTLTKVENGEKIITAKINPDEYTELRMERLSNRKPTAYELT